MRSSPHTRPEVKAAYDKILDEVDAGVMRGPFSEVQIIQKHGPNYNATRHFSIEQGTKEKKNEDGSVVVDSANKQFWYLNTEQ